MIREYLALLLGGFVMTRSSSVAVPVPVLLVLGGLVLASATAHAEEKVLMSFPRFGIEATHRVVSVDAAAREARIAATDERFFFMVSEGPSLLVVPSAEGEDPDTAVRVEVTEIMEDGSLRATFGPGAVQVVRKGPAYLGRPFAGDLAGGPPKAAATKAVRGLPDVVRPMSSEAPVADGDRPGVDPLQAARAAARRAQSMNNLKQLALAFHNYVDANDRFPPAAVIGPDGKPWHSWRVLLLPYLDQAGLYEQYDFSQPWDSPKNREVAEKMPALFRDPAREGPPDSFTDYAAIVGERCIFPPGLVTMENADDFPACLIRAKKIWFAGVTDGTSNTIMFATLDPSRKVPWTKPEDIVVGREFAGVGAADGIGAIHPAGDAKVGIAAFTDGSVQTLGDSTDAETILALLTRDGGEVVDRTALVTPGAPEPRNGPPTVKIVAGDDGRLRVEVE